MPTQKPSKKTQRSDAQSETKKSSKRSKSETVTTQTIYIGHLPNKFNEKALHKFASQFGPIVNLVISRSPKTGGSRGYGYIEFETVEAASQAAHDLNGCFLQNKCIVAEMVDDVHKNTFSRPDQKRRIKFDLQKRLNGHIPTLEKNTRETKEEVQKALEKMIAVEKKYNEKNAALGIDYEFHGFSAQKI